MTDSRNGDQDFSSRLDRVHSAFYYFGTNKMHLKKPVKTINFFSRKLGFAFFYVTATKNQLLHETHVHFVNKKNLKDFKMFLGNRDA